VIHAHDVLVALREANRYRHAHDHTHDEQRCTFHMRLPAGSLFFADIEVNAGSRSADLWTSDGGLSVFEA
jgi:hypothetical protein